MLGDTCTCRNCQIIALLLRGALAARGYTQEATERVVVHGSGLDGKVPAALAHVGVRRADGTIREVRRIYDLDESLELVAEPGIKELEFALEMEL